MYWSWTLPWNNAESLVGILVANDVDMMNQDGNFTASLVSIGLLFGRVDLIFNLEKIEE